MYRYIYSLYIFSYKVVGMHILYYIYILVIEKIYLPTYIQKMDFVIITEYILINTL